MNLKKDRQCSGIPAEKQTESVTMEVVHGTGHTHLK